MLGSFRSPASGKCVEQSKDAKGLLSITKWAVSATSPRGLGVHFQQEPLYCQDEPPFSRWTKSYNNLGNLLFVRR